MKEDDPMLLNQLKSMYRAGASGQPMPARVDRSIGETASAAAITVGMTFGIVFAIGAGAAASDRLFGRLSQSRTTIYKKDEGLDSAISSLLL